MFDFLGRRGAIGRPSGDRRKIRGPVTIGFEQLEGREMLTSGLALTIIPSLAPTPAIQPRPIVGSVDPEADAEGAVTVAGPIRIRVRVEPTQPEQRWARPWPIGGRSRFGWGRMGDDR